MLARSSKIQHPLGVAVETPLLVPSFSSKGAGFNKAGQSNIKEIFEGVASKYLTDIMLVSAFDLAKGHIPSIVSAVTEMTIIDSGGYEISDLHDLSTVYQHSPSPHEVSEWVEERLCEVYNSWPEHIPAVLVSFDRPDRPQPLQNQIKAARRLFSNYQHQVNTLLIKPESEGQNFIDAKNIIAHIEKFDDFDIIGFTEKEAGDSIIARMENIASIRLAMDDAGIKIPIHVFGSLDPISTVLYFLAGAEVFDGLTWIRFGFMDGVAYYYHNYGASKIGIDLADNIIKGQMMENNISYLINLKHQMQKFLVHNDFRVFGRNAEVFSRSYNQLRAKNRRIQ
jgi:hypothetical protein